MREWGEGVAAVPARGMCHEWEAVAGVGGGGDEQPPSADACGVSAWGEGVG